MHDCENPLDSIEVCSNGVLFPDEKAFLESLVDSSDEWEMYDFLVLYEKSEIAKKYLTRLISSKIKKAEKAHDYEDHYKMVKMLKMVRIA